MASRSITFSSTIEKNHRPNIFTNSTKTFYEANVSRLVNKCTLLRTSFSTDSAVSSIIKNKPGRHRCAVSNSRSRSAAQLCCTVLGYFPRNNCRWIRTFFGLSVRLVATASQDCGIAIAIAIPVIACKSELGPGTRLHTRVTRVRTRHTYAVLQSQAARDVCRVLGSLCEGEQLKSHCKSRCLIESIAKSRLEFGSYCICNSHVAVFNIARSIKVYAWQSCGNSHCKMARGKLRYSIWFREQLAEIYSSRPYRASRWHTSSQQRLDHCMHFRWVQGTWVLNCIEKSHKAHGNQRCDYFFGERQAEYCHWKRQSPNLSTFFSCWNFAVKFRRVPCDALLITTFSVGHERVNPALAAKVHHSSCIVIFIPLAVLYRLPSHY